MINNSHVGTAIVHSDGEIELILGYCMPSTLEIYKQMAEGKVVSLFIGVNLTKNPNDRHHDLPTQDNSTPPNLAHIWSRDEP
jgi:hypothetical protein